MKKIDDYSFNLGVIDCFNEMIASDVKNIALSHPFSDEKELRELLSGVEGICKKHDTKYYIEHDFLITDLFPKSYTQNTSLYIFYKNEEVLDIYIRIKALKQIMTEQGTYTEHYRKEIATCFGLLLGYSDERIEALITKNTDKEDN